MRRAQNGHTPGKIARSAAVAERHAFPGPAEPNRPSTVANHGVQFGQSVRVSEGFPGPVSSCIFAALALAGAACGPGNQGGTHRLPIPGDVDITVRHPKIDRYPLLNLPAPPAGKPSGHPLTQVSIDLSVDTRIS